MAAAPKAVYREIPPSPVLRGLVECYWTIRSDGPLRRAQPNRVVPDGCTDLIFDLGDPPAGTDGPHGRPRRYFVGAMRRPLVVRMTGTVDLFGVRLRPGAAGALLTMPAAELTDRTVPIDDVLPGRPGDEMEETVACAPSVERRVAAFERLLRRRLARTDPPPAAVRAAVGMIDRSRGAVTVGEMHERIGLSTRQLQRLFAESVGVPPKTACRVARFRSAWERLHRDPDARLSAVAYGCGYADQAHFTREFKEFAGVTPGEWVAGRGTPHSHRIDPSR